MKINKIVAISFICLMAIACGDDFLDLAPVSNSNATNFYQTQADFELAANAAYATLYTSYGPDCGASYCAEQMSDNGTMYHVAGNVADRWAFKDYTLMPSNSIVYQFWQQYYNSLFTINIVLDKIEEADLDATFKEDVKAEMKFLRALNYFNMVQIWGELPLVTKPITAKESYDILRSPVSEVYNLIIQDLQDAIAILPLASNVSAPGKVSKGAAQTLLGKVYLTQGDEASAAQILRVVYDSDEYGLVTGYADLWALGNKNTVESIFEIQFIGGAGNPYSVYYPTFAPFENFSFTAASGGMNMVTDDLYDEYETGDIRRDISIDTGYTNASDEFVPIKFPQKWVDTTVVYGSEYCDNNFMVLRYADLLLLLAEATGEPAYLNEVRDRVGLPAFGNAGYPSDLYPTLDLAIEHERRVELALEFHRWFDLKRTGRAVELLSAKGKDVTEQKLLLPIPEKVRQQNSAITQNNGYN